MHKIIWEFVAEPERVEAFRRAYASDGPWARLFDGAEGFLGTELLHDSAEGTYLTIDSWRSMADFENFKLERKREYEELDRQLDSLTISERRLGNYDSV